MEKAALRALLTQADDLSTEQSQELEAFLAGRSPRDKVTAAIEASVHDKRRCPHCSHGDSVRRGKTDGLQRFLCKKCGKTFNALTGTPLAGLRKKGLWTDFGQSLGDGENLVELAKRCGVAVSTVYRWRERFLAGGGTPIVTGMGVKAQPCENVR